MKDDDKTADLIVNQISGLFNIKIFPLTRQLFIDKNMIIPYSEIILLEQHSGG